MNAGGDSGVSGSTATGGSTGALAVALSLAFPLLACGGKTNSPVPSPAAIDSCSAGWEPLTPHRSDVFARQLIEYNGELLYYAFDLEGVPHIEAQPIAGGSPRMVAQVGLVWDLWTSCLGISSITPGKIASGRYLQVVARPCS